MKALAACLLSALVAVAPAAAAPPDDIMAIPTRHDFDTLWSRLESAVEANDMGIVARASASRGAAARGVTIPGNAVVMVFRNDFAVRMLEADVMAGIEAPLRFYVTENADGTATLSYRPPSAVFAPYGASLSPLADELDRIFARIAADAAAP